MTVFAYQARNRSGDPFSGTLEADSLHDAAQAVRQRGLWIVRLERVRSSSARSAVCSSRIKWRSPGPRLVLLFCRQLAVLLSAGLPVHEALKALQVSGQGGLYQQLISGLLQAVVQGKTLADAMRGFPAVFSPTVINLIQAGETGGSLETVFCRLADFQEKSYEAGEKLKSVLLYPVILGGTTLAAFCFMTVFILPAFASMLLNLHTELPLLTRMLLAVSAVVQQHGFLLLLVLIGLITAAYTLYRCPAVRLQVDRLCLRLPLYGGLRRDADWMLVLGTLSLLLETGIPLHQALGMVRNVAANHYLQLQLQQLQQSVERGRSLADSLFSCQHFPDMAREIVQAGEQAGALDRMLQKAADFCAVTAANESQRLQALAEPLAILLVGGLVFCFVLSIILPLLGMIDYMI